jgi:hypothetical protein
MTPRSGENMLSVLSKNIHGSRPLYPKFSLCPMYGLYLELLSGASEIVMC